MLCGGHSSAERLQIEPTLLDQVSPDSPLMAEEIFGPLLPILTFSERAQAVEFVNARPHPLALYLFTSDKAFSDQVLSSVSFGGGCVNDTIIHLATSRMGFGGVGPSGMANTTASAALTPLPTKRAS
ncbi:MAG: aldehyde dehydrogenase family protein [Christensenellales bacterium]